MRSHRIGRVRINQGDWIFSLMSKANNNKPSSWQCAALIGVCLLAGLLLLAGGVVIGLLDISDYSEREPGEKRGSPYYEIQLTDHYLLAMGGSDNYSILVRTMSGRPSEPLIMIVDRYAVAGAYIIGHEGSPGEPLAPPGYFMVDSRSGQVVDRLAGPQWTTRVKALTGKDPPPLLEPKRPCLIGGKLHLRP